MPRPDNDDITRVREATDIVQIIGQHVALRPKGREFVGLCPFHDDHSPSLCVVPSKQIYKCFACGAGGNVFTFLQRALGMEFREALEYLAQRAGIDLRPHAAASPDTSPSIPRRALLDANAYALRFFQRIFEHPDHGRAARHAAAQRGISADMLRTFALGAAPDRWDGLAHTLRTNARDPAPFVAAGLLKERDGRLYDAFRNRLIFPIRDLAGRVVGFGGRRLADDDSAKYINTAESPVFDKSRILYGLPEAARHIQRTGTAVVCEGYTDVIACHQAGFQNVVGTLGTALTRQHADILRRLCRSVVLLFDSDEAGRRAADRAVDVFFAQALDVRIATLGHDAKDPDELLRLDNGPDRFRQLLDDAPDLITYRVQRLRAALTDTGPGAAARAVEEELRRLVDLGLDDLPPIRQKFIRRRLAQAAGLDEGTLLLSLPPRPRAPAPARPGSAEPLDHAQWLLAAALAEPSLLPPTAAALRRAGPTDEPMQRALEALEHAVAAGSATLAGVLDRIDDPRTQAWIVSLHDRAESACDGDAERLRRLWDDARARLDAATPPEGETTRERIEAIRARHRATGGNRASLPRVR